MYSHFIEFDTLKKTLLGKIMVTGVKTSYGNNEFLKHLFTYLLM